MSENDTTTNEPCPGCGQVHGAPEDAQEYIGTHATALTDALKDRVMEDHIDPRIALAIAIGVTLRLAVEVRTKDMTQAQAMMGAAEAVARVAREHVAAVEADPEARKAAEADHELRKRRMGMIEEMLATEGPLADLLKQAARGSA